LDIDTNGYVHVGYFDNNSLNVKYSYFNGTGWDIQTIGTSMSTPGVSLKLDTNNTPGITYADEGISGLVYAKFNGTDWSTQVIDNTEIFYDSSLEFLNDNPRVSYGEGGGRLKYAEYNGTGWDVVFVESSVFGINTSLEVNSDGYSCISYVDFGNEDLKYAQFNGSGWDVTTVDTAGGYFTSMDIGTNGNVHISYEVGLQLRYAVFNGTGWTIQTVDSLTGGQYFSNTSFMLDSQGRPYVSYLTFDGSNTNLNLAYFNGSGWELEVLVTDIGGGFTDTSLALFSDYVYISYSTSSGNLAVLTNAPQGFVAEPSLNVLGIIIFILLICLWSGNQRLPLGPRPN